MDIFNKKKISQLDTTIRLLKAEMDSRFENLKDFPEVRCYKHYESIPDDEMISLIAKYLKAIMEYLKIDIKWHWEDDPNYLEPPKKQIRVWRAEKRK